MSRKIRVERVLVVAPPEQQAAVERLHRLAEEVSTTDGVACDATLGLSEMSGRSLPLSESDGMVVVVGASERLPDIVRTAAQVLRGGAVLRRVVVLAQRRYQDETSADAATRLGVPEGVGLVVFDADQALPPECRGMLAEWIVDGGGAAPAPAYGGRSISTEDGRAAVLHEARQLALAGRFDEAEACYLLAAARGDDPAAYLEYGTFQSQRGRLAEAAQSFERAVRYAEAREEWGIVARGCALLGLMRQTQGRMEEAEALQRRALELAVRHGDEEMISVGRTREGSLRKHRGDLAGAEALFKQSLRTDRQRGKLAAVASQYANLGLIARRRGDLAKAEQYLNRALELALRLDREDLIARQYGNLALVAKARGDLERAEALLRKAIDIHERLNLEQGLANDFTNLGRVLERRGQLDQAEAMHQRSLEIERRTGRIEGEARSLHSLGVIAAGKGSVADARGYWTEAQRLFTEVGLNDEAGLMGDLLAELKAGRTPRLVAGADGRIRRRRRAR